jgi:choline dehydrogenase-like flavoprotein
MGEEIDTDYCIAGGGVTGAVLAGKLAASGKKLIIRHTRAPI